MLISSGVILVAILLVIFILIVTAVLVILLTPRLVSELRLRSRARHDYRIARGTQHLQQLQGPLSQLKRDIQARPGQNKGDQA